MTSALDGVDSSLLTPPSVIVTSACLREAWDAYRGHLWWVSSTPVMPHVKMPAKRGPCLRWELPAKLGWVRGQLAGMRMPLRTSGRAEGKLAR